MMGTYRVTAERVTADDYTLRGTTGAIGRTQRQPSGQWHTFVARSGVVGDERYIGGSDTLTLAKSAFFIQTAPLG